MSRQLLTIATALLVVLLLAPAALAADGDEPAPTDAAPTPVPTLAPEPTATPFDGNGEIVVDETFVTTPSSTPAGQVHGATGKPQRTPPATDTAGVAATHGSALQPLLLLLVGGSAVALVVGSLPVLRPRRVRR